jgi:pSer/pThr/pTyr-binding forkhead associated (FHA) protein
MAKLVLKFGNRILQETPVSGGEVQIGRSPNCAIVIDNPAVSHSHARVFTEAGRLMVEDFGSLNGTLVNGQRIHSRTLRTGDSIAIGKHIILVEDSQEADCFPALVQSTRPSAPKVDETMVLATRERQEFLRRLAAEGECSQVAPSRLRVPTLIVRKGKTDQKEYMVTDKLTVIGKSPMATIKLRAWFAPRVAAQISRREDNSYYVGAAGKVPRVNGRLTARPTKLAPGDIIEVASIRLEFQYRD